MTVPSSCVCYHSGFFLLKSKAIFKFSSFCKGVLSGVKRKLIWSLLHNYILEKRVLKAWSWIKHYFWKKKLKVNKLKHKKNQGNIQICKLLDIVVLCGVSENECKLIRSCLNEYILENRILKASFSQQLLQQSRYASWKAVKMSFIMQINTATKD